MDNVVISDWSTYLSKTLFHVTLPNGHLPIEGQMKIHFDCNVGLFRFIDGVLYLKDWDFKQPRCVKCKETLLWNHLSRSETNSKEVDRYCSLCLIAKEQFVQGGVDWQLLAKRCEKVARYNFDTIVAHYQQFEKDFPSWVKEEKRESWRRCELQRMYQSAQKQMKQHQNADHDAWNWRRLAFALLGNSPT